LPGRTRPSSSDALAVTGERLLGLATHERLARFLEVRHDVEASAFDVAPLGRHRLMDLATIHPSAVEDHGVLAVADSFM
jgi:hypothetical protein